MEISNLYYMGLFNDKQISKTPGGDPGQTPGPAGPKGDPGIGFKQDSTGNFVIDAKMFNIETQKDVAEDSDYNTIKKDYSSAVNKGYLNNHFLKKDKTDVYFDLKGYSIQNSEVYDWSSWNDKTLITKGYADMKDNLKADKTELAKKADLETSDEQTFKGILNIPNFDPGYSNMTNVMNKKYIDQKLDMKTTVPQTLKSRLQVPNHDASSSNESDVPNIKYLSEKYLNKEAGGQLQNSILFNSFHPDSKRQIYYLGDPLYYSSATNKAYVDSEIQKVVFIDGSHTMTGDLDMGINKIISLEKPTNDNDAINKKYLEDHVGESHVQSANAENKFKYIMNDPNAQLSEEDDVKLGNIVSYQNSSHQINKKVVDMKLLLDSSKGYYSSRVGLNLYPLSNDEYTVCLEIMWLNDNIDPNSLHIDGTSSIETIRNVNRKTFKTQKYVRLICQFTKSQNIGNNYLYIDVVMKMKSGSTYDQELQTYFTVNGISGHQYNIDQNIYDSFMNFENDEINFEKIIDMNDNLIIGVKNADRDKAAVNLKQMKNYYDSLKITLETKITELKTTMNTNIKTSYYTEIFETFFDITDPNSFIVADTYGALVQYVKCQNDNGFIVTEYMKDDFNLSLFNKHLGAVLNGAVVSLSKAISTNKYTILISFEHDTNYKDASKNLVGFGGLTPDKKFIYSDPRYSINDRRLIINNQNDDDHQLSLLSQYKNKNLFMWIMKNGNNVRYGLVNGAYLDKTINARNVTSRNIIIKLPYKIKRIGISSNAYSFSSKEFNKICFLERENGVYFI